jgi:hypothetical protein
LSLHRVCCCGQQPCQCTGCDFQSSYIVACSSVTGTWLYNWKATSPCSPPCASQESGAIRDIDVYISVTIPSGTLTRSGSSACCYTRTGYCEVNYTVTIVDKGQCCFSPPADNVCTKTNTFSGTASVRFCHTVVPCCFNQTNCRWQHTTSICPFYIGTGEFIDDVSLQDCDYFTGLDCENAPLTYRDVSIGCARWQYISPYVSLSTMSANDFTSNGFCATGCAPDCECGHCQVQYNITGPFSLLWGSPPNECENPPPSGFIGVGSWSDCSNYSSKQTEDCFDFDFDDTCCTREFHFAFTPPCYS